MGGTAAGIDVSDYQGDITTTEWTQIHNDGKDFAWTKATEGGGFNATTFVNNMNRGTAAGVYMGAYHYARPDLNGAEPRMPHISSLSRGRTLRTATFARCSTSKGIASVSARRPFPIGSILSALM